MDEELIRLKLEAYRNEIDFLQHEVERYKEQNRQLIEIIFKLKDKNNEHNPNRQP